MFNARYFLVKIRPKAAQVHLKLRECFAPCGNDPRATPHTCVSMKKLRNLKPGIEICRRFDVIFMKIEIFLKIVFI